MKMNTISCDWVCISLVISRPWPQSDCPSVRNYQKVVFGEGAKTSHKMQISTGNDAQNAKDNIWHNKENHSKLCTEGAVVNMLFHMNLIENALEFRRIASLPPKLLLEAMGVSVFPQKTSGHSSWHRSYWKMRVDFGKEIQLPQIWILESHAIYNCCIGWKSATSSAANNTFSCWKEFDLQPCGYCVARWRDWLRRKGQVSA